VIFKTKNIIVVLLHLILPDKQFKAYFVEQ